jgi:hypothetical protein
MRLNEMEGFFVGMLDDEELAEFERAIDAGRARRVYEGASGLMGLAKVRLIREGAPAPGGAE